MTEDAQLQVETDPSGRYIRYKSVLGRGAYKTVYRAFDTDEALEVAWNKLHVNRLSEHDLEKVSNEVSLLRQVEHKNIIHFYDTWRGIDGNGNQTIDFITEQMMSGTLKEYLKKAKAIKLKVIRRWCSNILEAIAYLHSQNPPIMHRDLKCDNIFINGHVGEVKIGDLGLSGVKEREKAGSIIGTPEFMAPELYEESYTEKVDVYAFGMCLLEMVSMEYPYLECGSMAAICRKVLGGDKPEAYSKLVDGDVKHVIWACLQREARRPSAQELLDHPLFAEWEKDSGKASNLTLVKGTPESRYAELSSAQTPTTMPIGTELIEWSDPLNRNVLVSMVRGDGDGADAEVSVVASNEGGGFCLGLEIPIGEAIKRVEFTFDPFQDNSQHIAHEMVAEFNLDKDQLLVIQDEIDSQVLAARQYREEASRNATPQPPPRTDPSVIGSSSAGVEGAALAHQGTQHASQQVAPQSVSPASAVTPVLSTPPSVEIQTTKPSTAHASQHRIQQQQHVQQQYVQQQQQPVHQQQHAQQPLAQQESASQQPVPAVQQGHHVQHLPPTQPTLPSQQVPALEQTSAGQHVPVGQQAPVGHETRSYQQVQHVQQQGQHHQQRVQPAPPQIVQAPSQHMMPPQTQAQPLQQQAQPLQQQAQPLQQQAQPLQQQAKPLQQQSQPLQQQAQPLQQQTQPLQQQSQPLQQQPQPLQQQALQQHAHALQQHAQPMQQQEQSLQRQAQSLQQQQPPLQHHMQSLQQQGLPLQHHVQPLQQQMQSTQQQPHSLQHSQSMSQPVFHPPPQVTQPEMETQPQPVQQMRPPSLLPPQQQKQQPYQQQGIPTPQSSRLDDASFHVIPQSISDGQLPQPVASAMTPADLPPRPPSSPPVAPLTSAAGGGSGMMLQSAVNGNGTPVPPLDLESVAEDEAAHDRKSAPPPKSYAFAVSGSIAQPPKSSEHLRGKLPRQGTGTLPAIVVVGGDRPRSISRENVSNVPNQSNLSAKSLPNFSRVESSQSLLTAVNTGGSSSVSSSGLMAAGSAVTPGGGSSNSAPAASSVPKAPNSQSPSNISMRTSSWKSIHSDDSGNNLAPRISAGGAVLGDKYDQKWYTMCLELMEHCAYGRYDQVLEKLGQGASAKFADYDKRTPLHLAASGGYTNVCSLLIAHGGAVDARDRWGRTPMTDAQNNKHVEVTELLQRNGATDESDSSADRPSHELMMFVHKGNLDAVRERLVAGASATFSDYDLRTPLHLACSEGHVEIAELLLVNGADPSVRDRMGHSPVDDAVKNGHRTILRVLKQYGAEIPVHLLEAHPESEHQLGMDLVEHAARGRASAVRKSLQKGADPNFQDYDKRTPLHLACVEGHLNVVGVLLKAGASMNAIDRWGATARDEASKGDHPAILDELNHWEMREVRRPQRQVSTVSFDQTSYVANGHGHSSAATKTSEPSVSSRSEAENDPFGHMRSEMAHSVSMGILPDMHLCSDGFADNSFSDGHMYSPHRNDNQNNEGARGSFTSETVSLPPTPLGSMDGGLLEDEKRLVLEQYLAEKQRLEEDRKRNEMNLSLAMQGFRRRQSAESIRSVRNSQDVTPVARVETPPYVPVEDTMSLSALDDRKSTVEREIAMLAPPRRKVMTHLEATDVAQALTSSQESVGIPDTAVVAVSEGLVSGQGARGIPAVDVALDDEDGSLAVDAALDDDDFSTAVNASLGDEHGSPAVDAILKNDDAQVLNVSEVGSEAMMLALVGRMVDVAIQGNDASSL